MTRAFASPEQLRGDAPTAAADVFALGRILEGIADGARDPRSASTRSVLEVARRALDPDAATRPAEAGELARALRAATGRTIAAPASAMLAAALGLAGLSLVAGTLLGRPPERPGFVAVPASLFEDLGDLPLADVEGRPGDLLELSVELDSVGLAAAAIASALEEGDLRGAREIAGDPRLADRRGPPDHHLELARHQSELGWVRLARDTLQRVDGDDLDPADRAVHRWLSALAAMRSGEQVELETLAALEEGARLVDDEELADEVRHHRLGRGDAGAVLARLDEAASGREPHPGELDAGELRALLRLHLGLVDRGLASLLDEAIRHELETDLAHEVRDDPSPASMRALALIHRIRARGLAGSDPAAARDLLARARRDLDGRGAPLDAILGLARAGALLALGPEADEAWGEAADLAARGLGEGAALTTAIRSAPTAALDPRVDDAVRDLSPALLPWWLGSAD